MPGSRTCADPVAIVHTSFFSGVGLWATAPTAPRGTPGRWANASGLRRVQLDASIGQSFGVAVADIDGDGNALELLATNHVDNETLAGVYAYKLMGANADPMLPSSWERAALTTGFLVRIPGPGQAAPGQAIAFTPCQGGAAHGSGVAADPSLS